MLPTFRTSKCIVDEIRGFSHFGDRKMTKFACCTNSIYYTFWRLSILLSILQTEVRKVGNNPQGNKFPCLQLKSSEDDSNTFEKGKTEILHLHLNPL